MASIGDDDSDTESLLDSPSIQRMPILPTRDSEHRMSSDADPRSDNAESTLADSDSSEDAGGETSDSENESDDRENRFIGPSSTWRFFTEDERSLAASLDQQRANDLSLHLYNAHALKSRVRDPDDLSNAKISRKKKQRIGVSDDGSLPWQPEAMWTSWPLKPDDVPRREERFGVAIDIAELDGTTFKKVEAWNPRADLEEEIQALMLRKVTEKHRERRTGESFGTNEAVILLDEDKAEAALRPTARRIVSQLGDLFERLRGNGEQYVRGNSGVRPKLRSKAVSEGDPPSSMRKKNAPTSNEFVEDSGSEYSEATPSGKSSPRKRARELRPLRPRDWKEVLNMAALVGFDHADVDRATRRCASLFGGNLELPALYDCPIVECKRHGRPFERAWRWREHLRRTHKYSLEQVYDIEAGSRTVDMEADRDKRSMGIAKID